MRDWTSQIAYPHRSWYTTFWAVLSDREWINQIEL